MTARSFGVVAGMVLFVFASSGSPAAAETTKSSDGPEGPTIEVVQNIDADSRTFGVEGSGWSPNTLVQLELCGNNARAGTVDCVPGVALIVGANREGVVRGRVSTTPPPSPCPCVVRALSLTTGEIATAPVRVPGVPEMLLDPDDEGVPVIRELAISARLVDEGSPWPAWLGASPRRTIVLTAANIGNVPISDAVLSMTVGRSDPPNGFVEPIPLGDFAPEEAREIRIPVDLPAMAWGEYHVRGEISGATDPITFTDSTTSYPWLLVFVPALVMLHLLLLPVRNALRRRVARNQPPDDESPIAEPPAPAAPTPPALALGAGALALDAGEAPEAEPAPVGSDLVYVVEVDEGRAGSDAFTDLDRAVLDRIVYEHHDEYRNRSVFTVLGMDAAKGLISAAVYRDDPGGVFPPRRRRGAVDVVAVPPIVTADEGAIEEVSQELGRWLGDTLGLPVYLSSRRDGAGAHTSVRVGDGPDFGAAHVHPTQLWVRLEAGLPTVSYRLVLDTETPHEVHRFVDELQARGVLALVEHRVGTTEILLRVHDVQVLHAAYELAAERFLILDRQVIGLVPLRVLENVPRSYLEDLGIGPTDSFEYRIIAMAETRVLAAPSRSLAPVAG
jgi:glutamate formiminotransferase